MTSNNGEGDTPEPGGEEFPEDVSENEPQIPEAPESGQDDATEMPTEEGPLLGGDAEPDQEWQGPLHEPQQNRKWVPAAIIGAVVVLGLVAWIYIPRTSAPLAVVERLPAEVQFYTEADLEALGSEDTRSLVGEIIPFYEAITGETVTSTELGDMIASQLEEGLSEVGISFEEDIATWLSGRVAFGVYGIDPESLPTDPAALDDLTEMDPESPGEMPMEDIPNMVLIASGSESAELDEFLTTLDDAVASEGEAEVETVTVEGNDIRTISDEEVSAAYGRVGSDFLFSITAPEEDPTTVFTESDAPTLGEDEDFQAVVGEIPDGALVQWGVSGDLAGAFSESSFPWTGGYVTLADGDLEFASLAPVTEENTQMLADLWSGEAASATHIPVEDSILFIRPGAIGTPLSEMITTLSEETPEIGEQITQFEQQSGFTMDEVTALFSTDTALGLGWDDGSPTPSGVLAAVGEGDPQSVIERLGQQFGDLDPSIQQVENGYSMANMGGLGWRGDDTTVLVFGHPLTPEAPEESVLDSEAYARAGELVPGEVVFFLDIDAAVEVAKTQAAGFGAEIPTEITDCNPFRFVAGGVESGGDLVKSSMKVEVETPEGCQSDGGEGGTEDTDSDDTATETTEAS